MKILIIFLIVLFLCPLVLAKEQVSPQKYYFNYRIGDENIDYNDRASMYHYYLDSKKWSREIQEDDFRVWR